MQYTIEVNSPSFAGYFHQLIIEKDAADPDAIEAIGMEIDACQGVDFPIVIRPGDDLWGHPAPAYQMLFWSPRDLSADFPALIERALETA